MTLDMIQNPMASASDDLAVQLLYQMVGGRTKFISYGNRETTPLEVLEAYRNADRETSFYRHFSYRALESLGLDEIRSLAGLLRDVETKA